MFLFVSVRDVNTTNSYELSFGEMLTVRHHGRSLPHRKPLQSRPNSAVTSGPCMVSSDGMDGKDDTFRSAT